MMRQNCIPFFPAFHFFLAGRRGCLHGAQNELRPCQKQVSIISQRPLENGRQTLRAAIMMRQIAIIICLYASLCSAQSFRGADIPWTTYEAEAMTNTGTTLGPKYDPYLVETESSGQKCVKLAATGQFVEFIAQSPANAIVYATVCRTRRAEAASTPPSASTRMASSSKNFR